MQISDNIKANDRDFYPTVDSNFVPYGGVRIYATWTADLGDNAMDGIKAYQVFKFNNNNKIIEVDEYMDMTRVHCKKLVMICQPAIKKYAHKNKNILYLNSGDWIENLMALEYHNKEWKIYQHDLNQVEEELVQDNTDLSPKELFQQMMNEFKIMEN